MASRAARRFWVRAVLSPGVYHSLSFSLGFAVSFAVSFWLFGSVFFLPLV